MNHRTLLQYEINVLLNTTIILVTVFPFVNFNPYKNHVLNVLT